MKTNLKNLFFATSAIITVALSAPSAHAVNLYWDTNGTEVSDSGAATGTWGTDAFWSTDSTGNNDGPVTLTAATTGVDDLFFSAGTTGTGGTVTLAANQDANSLTFEEDAVTLSGNTITLAAGGITVATGAGDAIIGSALTATGTRIYDVGAGRTLTLNGVFTGGIAKSGTGTMTMGNVAHSITSMTVDQGLLIANTATGDSLSNATINNGGTLRWGANDRFNNGAAFTINSGGTLDISNRSDLVGAFNGAGSITGTGLLQVQGGTSNFTGLISGTGLRLRLWRDAASTVTLSNSNTYTGTTTIERGTLNINSIGNVNGGVSAIGNPSSANNGRIVMGFTNLTGTLVYTGTGHSTDRQITIGANSTTPANTDTGGATITANGDSNAALTFSNATFNGQTNAASGAGANRTLTLQGTSTGANNISGVIRDNLISGTATGTAKVGLTKVEAGTWVLSGANTYTGATLISGGTLQIGNGIGNTGSIATASAITNNATLRINRGAALDMANNISGTGNLVKDFAFGDLILNGNNSYGGGTSVNAGRLFINTTNSLPTTGNVTVANGATLAFNVSGAYNQSISLADGAKLNVRAGAVTLGNVTLPTAGSVIFNHDDAATSAFSLGSNVALTGNLTVQVGGVGSNPTIGAVTLGGVISGGFGLTKTQVGVLALSGANDYTGDTTVSDGTLAVNGTALPDGTKLTINAGNIDLTNAETVNTLFFGVVQQPAGVYSASSVPGGATITTASFTGTGTLIVSTGPVTNGYAAWQTANITAQTADLDHDNDGVSNGVEHFLGGNTNTTGFTALPGVDNAAGVLSVTWTKAATGYAGTYGSGFVVETSATLNGDWATELADPTPGFTVTFPSATEVKYTFPAGTKSFARLKVIVP